MDAEMAAKLPQLGPEFNSGIFREDTMREVTRVREELRTAGIEGTAAQLVSLLEELELYVVDCDVLVNTLIGKEVARLGKHANAQVARRAKELIELWKNDK